MKKPKTIQELINEKKQEKDLKEKLGIESSEDKIILEKKNILVQFFSLLVNILVLLFKAIFFISVAVLSTIRAYCAYKRAIKRTFCFIA